MNLHYHKIVADDMEGQVLVNRHLKIVKSNRVVDKIVTRRVQ